MKIDGAMGRGAACCAPTSFKRTISCCHPIAMNSLALLLAVFAPAHPHARPVVKEVVQYTLRVDSTDLSGWTIEMRFQNKSGTFRLAMAAHPEYDDRYWRYVRNVAVEPSGTITKVDSAVWQFDAPEGWVTVRYRDIA